MACILERDEVAKALISLHMEHKVPLSLQYTRALRACWRREGEEGYWVIEALGEDRHWMVNVNIPAKERSKDPVVIARIKSDARSIAESRRDAEGSEAYWELLTGKGWHECTKMTVKDMPPRGAGRPPRIEVKGAVRYYSKEEEADEEEVVREIAHDINGLFEKVEVDRAGDRCEWMQVDVRTDVSPIPPPRPPAHGSCSIALKLCTESTSMTDMRVAVRCICLRAGTIDLRGRKFLAHSDCQRG